MWRKYFFVLLILMCARTSEAGRISYAIMDCSDGKACKEVAKGVKSQSLKDVTVVKKGIVGYSQLSKSIGLDKGFSIGFTQSEEKEITGFAMWTKINSGGHSWDWFSKSKGDEFEKLQGTGLIKVTTRMASSSMEIVEIQFLTDVSLRLNMGLSTSVTHRVNIMKGSVLSFLQ